MLLFFAVMKSTFAQLLYLQFRGTSCNFMLPSHILEACAVHFSTIHLYENTSYSYFADCMLLQSILNVYYHQWD